MEPTHLVQCPCVQHKTLLSNLALDHNQIVIGYKTGAPPEIEAVDNVG